MRHSSPIWKISKDELIKIVNSNKTLTAIIKHFGLNTSGGTLSTLKSRLITDKIDFSHILQNCPNVSSWKRPIIPLELLLTKNSTYSRSLVKARIIKDKLIDLKCAECGLGPIWNNKPLVLILDHINGVNNDHRFDNLRFVCPNCDHQSPTFGSKNASKKFNCQVCGIIVGRNSRYCTKCSSSINAKLKVQYNTEWPSDEELQEMVWKCPTSEIAKKLGVSDKAVAKRCKKHNINKPGPGYWAQKGIA